MTRHFQIRTNTAIVAGIVVLCIGTASAQWVEDSIDVGGRWVGGMVYNSRADVVYGNCQYTDGIFFAIDCSTNQLAASWRIPWPREAAYDSIDNKCYVAFQDGGEDSVMVVDGQTHTRMKAIPLDGANIPVWDPVSNRLYVSCLERNRVSVIDCATDSVIAHIPTPAGPLKMHLNTLHRKLYVLCHDAESLAIVDLNTNQIRRRIGLTLPPEMGCYDAAVDKYYCNDGPGRVAVIDGTTDSLLGHVVFEHGEMAYAAAGHPGSDLVMFAVWGLHGNYVYVADGVGDSVLSILEVGRTPRGLCWSEPSDLVYCANSASDDVSVIRGDGSAVLTTLDAADYPFVMVAVPRHDRIYLGHLNGNMVYVIKDRVGGIEEYGGDSGMARYGLRVWPNPFKSKLAIETARPGAVAVYSRDGRLVRQLEARTGATVWDGSDVSGRETPAGVYYVAALGTSLRVAVVKLD